MCQQNSPGNRKLFCLLRLSRLYVSDEGDGLVEDADEDQALLRRPHHQAKHDGMRAVDADRYVGDGVLERCTDRNFVSVYLKPGLGEHLADKVSVVATVNRNDIWCFAPATAGCFYEGAGGFAARSPLLASPS